MEKDKLFINDSGDNYYGSEQLTSNYFNPNWDTQLDQSDPFESNLSSIVSSPAVSTPVNNGGGGDFLIRELIGRLGDISSNNNNNSTVNSTNSSRHITPLNSPKLSNMDSHIRGSLPNHPSLGSFAAADPCFADRAARFSSFGGFNLTELPQLNVIDKDLNSTGGDKKFGGLWSSASNSIVENGGDSMEQSTVSEQVPSDELNLKIANGRKRKVIPRGKAKENHLSTTDCKVAVNDKSNAKRSKTDELKKAKEEENNGGADSSNPKQDKENSKPEPPKDYIHVRARRGQATDSHSLAERVRREKISERMKFLQDLVPGCNKVTGKAVMLDEIINYVQSLQHQVEFLSMKLATVNPTIHYNLEPVLSKDIFQYREALTHAHFQHQNGLHSLHEHNAAANQFSINPINGSGLPKNVSLQMLMPHVHDVIHQTEEGLWGDDLQSVIQMGFGQEQPQNIHGSVRTAQ